jgi:hypothetical protein
MGTMETCDNLQTISLNISVNLNFMYHNDSFLKINSHRICYFPQKNQQFPVGSHAKLRVVPTKFDTNVFIMFQGGGSNHHQNHQNGKGPYNDPSFTDKTTKTKKAYIVAIANF